MTETKSEDRLTEPIAIVDNDDNTNTNININIKTDTDTNSICREKARLLYRGIGLAPMVRASTTPLRILALQYGADFTYTEELVDRSLSQTIRVENKDLQTIDYIKDPATLPKKTRKKLKADNNRPCLILRIDPKIEKGKLICQLGTGDPKLALAAAKRVVEDVDAIDVNMGCPKKFSVSGGMGSALLKDPDRAAQILLTLKNELLGPLGKPLSCKIRLLETTQETVEFVERMISAGADAVAIHARRVGHEPTVAADWNSLEEVLRVLRKRHRNFNFLVNGDFYDRKERVEFMERTKVDGLLLGRPALYNTSTFILPSSTSSTASHPISTTTLMDKTTVIQEYLRHSVRYDSHYKNTKYVICEMMSHRRTPTGRVPYLAMEFPQGQTIKDTCNCHNLGSLCDVWKVDYSDAIVSPSINTNYDSEYTANSSSAKMKTLTSGEHKYEDSYFLKNEDGNPKIVHKTKRVDEKNGENEKRKRNEQNSFKDREVQKFSKTTKISPEDAFAPSI